MSDGSKIEWLHTGGKRPATLNPTTGCTKVSDGCKNCYAKREWVRLSANPKTVYYGRKFEDVAMHEERLAIPMLATKPRRYFVDSMSDLFHDKITDDFIDRFFGVAAWCAQHTFIVLTKRSERLRAYFDDPERAAKIGAMQAWAIRKWSGNNHPALRYAAGASMLRLPIDNVQLGVSVESRKHLNRLDDLRAVPAAIRVLSAEPLLEDLGELYLTGIHQVYGGGETGPKSRPSAPAWFRSLQAQCARQGTAFFFKQWGDWAPPIDVPRENWKPRHDYVDGEYMMRVGKKGAGRLLDGVEHSELV
jgi:protein gp37